MKLAHDIVKLIKTQDFAEETAREQRALFVAQALAYRVPLENAPVEDLLAKYEPALLTLLNAINEALPVDVRLTRATYRKLLAARIELMQSVTDPSLLQYLLATDTTQSAFNDDMKTVIDASLNQRGFRDAQAQVAELFETDEFPQHS